MAGRPRTYLPLPGGHGKCLHCPSWSTKLSLLKPGTSPVDKAWSGALSIDQRRRKMGVHLLECPSAPVPLKKSRWGDRKRRDLDIACPFSLHGLSYSNDASLLTLERWAEHRTLEELDDMVALACAKGVLVSSAFSVAFMRTGLSKWLRDPSHTFHRVLDPFEGVNLVDMTLDRKTSYHSLPHDSRLLSLCRCVACLSLLCFLSHSHARRTVVASRLHRPASRLLCSLLSLCSSPKGCSCLPSTSRRSKTPPSRPPFASEKTWVPTPVSMVAKSRV
jgi:hypothetical protein